MQKTQLNTAPLGNTGPEISRVGFGAWAIGGGGGEFGWSPQDDEDSIEAIHRALELGDTDPMQIDDAEGRRAA